MVRDTSSSDIHAGEQPSIRRALAAAVERLAAVSESPRLDAEILLSQALDVPRSYLLAHPDDAPDAAALRRFAERLAARERGVPIAYLLGEREFWSLKLMVTPATLVPRPETELLVELALAALPHDARRRVVDLGTGSGAIALALAQERRLCEVLATDVSESALKVAAENARQLDLDNVRFVCGDWTAPLSGQRFDLIVSNPPYVADDDPALAALRHEPALALRAGADGLDALRVLATDTLSIAAGGAALLLEHGADQAEAVRDVLTRAGWLDVETHRDLAGRARVASARAP